MDSLIVGVTIGLVFVFAVLAALTSVLTEAVARFLGLRGDFLLRGIRALVDGQVDGPPQRQEVARIEPATPPATPTARGGTVTGQPDQEPPSLMDDLLRIEGLRSSGLPVGWTADPVCELARGTPGTGDDCSFAERFGLADRTGDRWVDVRFVLVLLVGYALMVVALLPGARFWFDLLGKLGSLRSSGPKPPQA